MSARKSAAVDPVVIELVAIKRLLTFSLLQSGTSQKQVAVALGIDQSQISRMFPGGTGNPTRGKAQTPRG